MGNNYMLYIVSFVLSVASGALVWAEKPALIKYTYDRQFVAQRPNARAWLKGAGKGIAIEGR